MPSVDASTRSRKHEQHNKHKHKCKCRQRYTRVLLVPLQVVTAFMLQLVDTIFSDKLHPEELDALKVKIVDSAQNDFNDIQGKLVDQETALRLCIFAWHDHEERTDQVGCVRLPSAVRYMLRLHERNTHC